MSIQAQHCSKKCKQEGKRRREQAELVAATADQTAALLRDLDAGGPSSSTAATVDHTHT